MNSEKNASYPQAAPQQGGQAGYYSQPPGVVMSQPGTVVVTQTRPTNYFIPSILVCLCCFWPTGLAAIYYSWQANQRVDEGDIQGAQQPNNCARNLIIASVVVGIVIIVLALVLHFVLAAAAVASVSSTLKAYQN